MARVVMLGNVREVAGRDQITCHPKDGELYSEGNGKPMETLS